MACTWLFGCLLIGAAVSVLAAPSSGPECSATTMQELSPRQRTVCAAYYALLSDAFKSYGADDSNNYPREPLVREGNQIYETGVKRQDVDHVFLRFGRRR